MYFMKIQPDMIAGGCAGLVGTVLGYPLDVVKSRMQSCPNQSTGELLNAIYAESGWKAFYRGLASPLLALVILNSLNFTLFSNISAKYEQFISSKLIVHVLSGASVGPAAAIISTPFEYIKIQMQLNKLLSLKDPSMVKYSNSLHASVAITKTEGFQMLYTGHSVNTVREMVFLGTYFGVYGQFKSWLSDGITPLHLSIPVAGGTAGAIGWLVSYPLDCVKSNIQQISKASIHTQRLSAWRIARDIVSRSGSGIVGLYAGVHWSLARAFIVSASRFACYEFVKDRL